MAEVVYFFWKAQSALLSRNARKDGLEDLGSHSFVFTINLEVPSSALKLEQQVVYGKNILRWDLA